MIDLLYSADFFTALSLKSSVRDFPNSDILGSFVSDGSNDLPWDRSGGAGSPKQAPIAIFSAM